MEARESSEAAGQSTQPLDEEAVRPDTPAEVATESPSGGDDAAKKPPEESVETRPAEGQDRAKPAASQTNDAAAKIPEPSGDSLPQTSETGEFVVQLGSFSDEQNAQALARSVESSGFDVFIEPLFSGQGTVWRVRVGPYQSRDLANETTERLRQRIGRDGLVMTK